nr:Armadillo type fold [Hymenolepis microstoma]
MRQEEFEKYFAKNSNRSLPRERDKGGNSLTHLAALHGNIPLLRFLIEKQEIEIETRNKHEQTPLFFAILSGSFEVVRLFLEVGASFDVADANGDTAIQISAKVNNLEITEFISTIGTDINRVNVSGESALHIACRLENLNSVIALTAASVNPNIISNDGDTALHLAVHKGSLEIARVLLGRFANPNITDSNGNLPLHLACAAGDQLMSQILCENGSRVNSHNLDQLTPLHLAAKSGNLELVRSLLYYGADSSIPNGLRITADVTAYALGHNAIGKLITSITSDRLIKFRDQFEPLLKKPRIKLKLFGSSLSGKTALSSSLRSGFIAGYFKRKMKAISHMADWLTDGETNSKFINLSKRKAKMFHAEHENYTRGIDIKNTNEFSIWEFSGYKPYYFLYYFFIGNTSCIHAVVYSLKDPPAVQREKVLFWLTFIHSRLPAQENGLLQSGAKVVLIATHADEVECSRDGEGYLYHGGAARLLQDFQRQFQYKLDIQSELHVLDANSPNTLEMKVLKHQLLRMRDVIVQEIPTASVIAEVISARIEEWNRAHLIPIKYWPEFIHLVQSRINPLCTEAVLRETVQFLQYTGDLMVLETDDGNDLIILNPSWVLTDAVGNLFSQDTISHARVTGSFTTDDLHFLISESDVGMVLEVLIALECCTIVKANVGQDQELESPAQSEARKQSIHSFFEDAAAGTNNLQNSTVVEEELQMEIPRLNLIQPSDITEVWGCGGEDMIRTGIQFKGSGAQLIHVFPRIQCRLRRATSSLLKPEGLESQELVQWLLGSRLSYNKGLINICLICDESEEAIEVKLETCKSLIPPAFNCFHDILILVRGALDEIVSQLSISNCLLVFKTSTFSRVCKEVVSQPTLFHLLTDSDGINFLELTIFMQNPQLRACCWFGGDIPASWIRYEVLLEVCSELGKNDGFSAAQLKDLNRLLGGEEIGTWDENESYDSRLNRLLQLIVNWRDCSENPVVGRLVNALQAVGLSAIDVAGRAQLFQNNIIGILLSLISNPDLKESRSLIQEIVSNIVSELHKDINNGGDSAPITEPFQYPSNFFEMPNRHYSAGNILNESTKKGSFSFHTAVAIANTALSGLITVRSSTAFRSSLLHLLNKAVDLFLHCTKIDLTWRLLGSTTLEFFKPIAESVLPSQNLTPGFDNMLELWGILLSTFSKSWRNDPNVDRPIEDFEQPRYIYIGLLKPLFRLLFSLWTPEACACLLPSMTSFEIALASLDCHFISNVIGNNSTVLFSYVRFFDPEIFLLYSKLIQISPAILASVDFIRSPENHQNFDLPNLGGLMTKAIEGLGVIEFIPNSYVPKFVSFLAEIQLYTDEPTCISLLSQSRPYLLMLLSHSNSNIRKITYDQIHEIISTSISVENAANPTSQDCKRITFLLNREVFGEIVEFGSNDSVPEIAATAKACLRLLLDSHHLIPESMWIAFVNLICEQSNDLNSLPYSTDWRPIQPFISLLAGLSAEINPALEAFLGHGGFKNALTNSFASTIPLLYHPQPHIRRKAASLVVKRMDFTIKHCAELYSSLDETLSDLLIITDPAMPINQAIFDELSCKVLAVGISSNHNDRKILIEAMELVGDGVADLGVRCNAAERVFAILNSLGNFELWHEANGPSILLDWVTSLSAQLGLNIVENLLIEPLVEVLLGITHYVVINDLKSRHHFYLNQSLFFKPILQVGLCFWKDLRIRRSISIIIALVIFTPAIRISDESSICLPPVVITSFCLPFICPFYSLKSRHPIEFPDLSCLFQQIANVSRFSELSQRERALSVAIVRALRVIWKSSAEGIEDGLVLDPILQMTGTESALIESANPTIAVLNTLRRLRTSNSHSEATSSLNYLILLKVAFMRTPEASTFINDHPLWWQEADLQRFLRVLPSCTEDYRLLIQCFQTFITFEFSPPFLSHHSLEACAWLLEEIVTSNSVLVYMMRRFDAGIGNTDSPRLVVEKQSLHFNVIPSLFDAILACQDYFRNSELSLRGGKSPYEVECNLKKCDNFEALHFLFQWSLKVVEVHCDSLNDHLAYLHSAVNILQRITQRPSWIFGVQRTEPVFTELCQLIEKLIQKILDLQQSFPPHNGILYSTLELSHNALLLLTYQNWRKSGRFLETSSLLSLVFELISKNTNSEVRFLSITILAQLVSLPSAIQERSCDPWHMAFSIFTSPGESPKMKSAAVHLLTNLIAIISRHQSPNDYPMPSYTDSHKGTEVFGSDALKYLLEQYRFFPLLSDMLKNYQPTPIFQSNKGKNNSEQIENTEVFSTPLLIDRVSSFLINFCQILPLDFILHQFEKYKLYEAFKSLINPALLDCLTSRCPAPPIVGWTAARHIASMFAKILRFFQTILLLSPNRSTKKQVFLSDRRFLVMLANCLTIGMEGTEELLESTMLFFITLLDLEGDDDSLDLVLLHALQPLASVSHQLGTLLNQLLSEAITVNKKPSSEPEEGSRKKSRSALFNLLQIALTFISTILSHPSPQQSSPFENPVCAAFDNLSTTTQITSSLITLATSFPQPIINLDGVLLDSEETRSMSDNKCPQIFGQLECHQQAVHSSLKILFCTSMRAKEAALETDFLSTLFTICNNLLDRLKRTMSHPRCSKHIALATINSTTPFMSNKPPISSSASDVSLSTHSEKQITDGRQQAWQCLVSYLLCYLEFFGNLFYNSRDVKRVAVQAGFLKLASNIWPLGLIDSRIMNNLLFCLINVTADSSILISDGSSNKSATTQPSLRPVIVSQLPSVGGSLMRSLGRLLDSSLVLYNTSSNRGQNTSPRPRSDDPNSRNRRFRPRQRNQNHDALAADIENTREQILRQIFDLLSNLAWFSEALGFFAKAKILSHFATLDAKALARVPKAQHLQRLWLQFITNLTFTREGQALLLNHPGAISVLVDHVRYCRDPENRAAAHLCLQNLCANASFKTFLYQRSYGILELLADTLEPLNNPPEILLQTITALSNAAYNCTKVRAFLKGEGFLHRLNNLKTFCQTNADGRVRSLLSSTELLISALAQ